MKEYSVQSLRIGRTKTYNNGDSLVVTHLTTNPPVFCFNRAERRGSLVISWLATSALKLKFTEGTLEQEIRHCAVVT